MNQGIAEQRLRELGIELPRASRPAAKYANFVIVNGLMFISGKGPTSGAKGKLGETYTTEEGYRYARETAIEVLAVLKSALGSLDKVRRVVKVQGFVNQGNRIRHLDSQGKARATNNRLSKNSTSSSNVDFSLPTGPA